MQYINRIQNHEHSTHSNKKYNVTALIITRHWSFEFFFLQFFALDWNSQVYFSGCLCCTFSDTESRHILIFYYFSGSKWNVRLSRVYCEGLICYNRQPILGTEHILSIVTLSAGASSSIFDLLAYLFVFFKYRYLSWCSINGGINQFAA